MAQVREMFSRANLGIFVGCPTLNGARFATLGWDFSIQCVSTNVRQRLGNGCRFSGAEILSLSIEPPFAAELDPHAHAVG